MEARDLLVPADHQAEGGGDLLDVDPEVGRPLPVDLDPQLGPVEAERRGEVEHAAHLDGALAQLLAEGRQRRELRPADDVVDVEVAAADVEPRDVPDGDADVAELAEALPDLLHHLALGVVAAEGSARIPAPEPFPEPARRDGALLVRRDPHVPAALVHPPEEVAARGQQHQPDSPDRADLAVHRLHHLVHGGEAHALGPFVADLELGLVHVRRHVLALHPAEQRDGRGDHRERQDHHHHAPGGVDRQAKEPSVGRHR